MEDITGTGGNAGSAGAETGAASPVAQTTTTATDAGSAVQSAQTTGTTTDSTDREGFIPRARFDEVNTRLQELKTFKEQYGWAESVQRDQLEQMAQWYSRYQGDPGDFLEHAYQEALSHPVHGATVKSRIGRMLASMKAQQQQQPERIEPGIPVMNDRGEIVAKTYTDAQLEQLLQQKLDAALDPYKQDLETRKQRAEREQRQEQVNARADADIAYVKARPGFAKFQKDILATFQANPKMTIRDAYDAVMDTKLPAEAEAKVLSDLQQKAHAQTVNPGTPSGSAPPTFKKFSEAHAYYEKHPEEAAAMAHRR
jgi:hypothetical protein